MNIVVLGDVLLDVDMNGAAERLCPDAPVPVVNVEQVVRRAGGAGLAAAMLVRDGHRVTLVTVLSDDRAAGDLRAALRTLVGLDVVAGPSGAPTPVKSRIRAQGQPLVRFDEGCGSAAVPEVTETMLAAVDAADVLLVSDYGRGLASNATLRELIRQRASEIPVVWDPHPCGADPVAGVAAVTPNLAEARKAAADAAGPAGSGAVSGSLEAAARAGSTLLARWQSRSVVVTLGVEGAMLLTGEGAVGHLVPAPKVTVADPCGAGDRFAASLALQLGHGTELAAAAQVAVREAAAFLAAGGVQSLQRQAPPVQMHSDSIDALRVVQETRDKGGTVVATGGCFDLLHAGHSRSLAAARDLGDCLIVCLNSDASVRRLKGDQRPIVGQRDRAELLLSLGCVDAVLIFDEDSPAMVLDRLRPDLWVKGADYSTDELPEAELVRSWGGQTVTVPYYPEHSTSALAAALSATG
ncbi:bifunctional heptose 7-phosphate kinase/heptose 1-phosphate adenyltransferase [Paeniglutamicibacter antarcticus]|uniref:Bifunctional heptose 7-phosphate kinase/heptose 1-phosphate adenyltransferase n=1 Tax=Arthrobacter terrae TaxID=2935737 RepID=A0A931G6N0_9MICC|nr:PfkB family carbohydrate kinase [Arthrobacter terrae]MBG0741223.1 bifunctional heptose 7-phosphate kinase/heptose 1-phosphate adenyltransferase [Arthrobacter terrae]